MGALLEQIKREKDFARKLENLVGRRFESIDTLKEFLTDYCQASNKVDIDFASQNWEEDHTCDWNLICNIENEFIFCDIDIYFLLDRENRLYITEVGYEFN